eukprot:GEMP01013046.1.p1 GENE.GEMP01013046.1~~GEMP01013046.1.p1  ORF type:complete len:809 (+),score=176.65 GEMP01013046.1:169-2595(+)
MTVTPETARVTLQEALQEFHVGDFEKSVKILEGLEKTLPTAACAFQSQLLHNMGVCYKKIGAANLNKEPLEEAKKKLEEALNLRPMKVPDLIAKTRCNLAQVHIMLGQEKKGEEILLTAQSEYKCWQVEMVFAELREKDRLHDAKAHVKIAQELALSESDRLVCLLDVLCFYHRHELPGAKQILQEASELTQSWVDEVEVEEARARIYALECNYEEAIPLYKNVTRMRREKCPTHPRHFAALLDMSRMCSNCKEVTLAKKAVSEARKLARTGNNRAAAINMEGMVYDSTNDLRNAQKSYEEAKTLPVTSRGVRAQTNLLLGNVLRKQKELKNAEQCYGDALEDLENCDYQSREVILTRSRLLHEMGTLWQEVGRYPEAETYLLEATKFRLQVSPPNEALYPIYKSLGQHYAQHRTERAEEMFLDAQAAAGKSGFYAVAAAFELGQFYQVHGDHEKASKELLKAKRFASELDKRHPDAKNTQVYQIRASEMLAGIYKKQGKHDLAWEHVTEGWAVAKLCPIKILEKVVVPLDNMMTEMKEIHCAEKESAKVVETREELSRRINAVFTADNALKVDPKRSITTDVLLRAINPPDKSKFSNDIVMQALLEVARFDNSAKLWSLKPKRPRQTDDSKCQASDSKRQPTESKRQADDSRRQADDCRRQADDSKRQPDSKRQADDCRRQADDSKRQPDSKRQADDSKRQPDSKRQANDSRGQADAKRRADPKRQADSKLQANDPRRLSKDSVRPSSDSERQSSDTERQSSDTECQSSDSGRPSSRSGRQSSYSWNQASNTGPRASNSGPGASDFV